MSSYDSTHSGYFHPSQYPPPQPHTQQQYPPQPPYPTTPGPPPTSQPQAFYPPTAQPQPTYSSSPSSNGGGGGGGGGGGQMYSSSPNAHHTIMPQDAPAHRSRRSSSLSAARPQMPYYQTAPIMIPSASTAHYAAAPPQAQFQHPSSSYNPPGYARRPSSHASHPSHHSSHMHDPHAWGDGEDRYGSGDRGPSNGGLDEETLREYERRYAKDRALEKRPTLGDSLMSAVGKMGRVFGSDRR